MTALYSDDIERASASCTHGDDCDDLSGIVRDLEIALGRMLNHLRRNPQAESVDYATGYVEDAIGNIKHERALTHEKLLDYAAHLKSRRA